MKIIFSILMSFALLPNLFAQDYYYYENRLISLEQRSDKVAFVLKSDLPLRELTLDNIKRILQPGDELKQVQGDVYQIKINDAGAQRISSYINVLSLRSQSIKLVTPVYYGESKTVSQIPADEFVVKLRSINDKVVLDQLNTLNNAYIIGNVGDERGFLIKTFDDNDKNALAMSDVYYRTGIFESAEPNFYYPDFCLLHLTPNDPLYSFQWALNNTGQLVSTGSNIMGDSASIRGIPGSDMDVNTAWDFTTGTSIKIGIVDTGIDSTHPDLRANILFPGFDGNWNRYGVPRDSGSHGTACAGIAAAKGNNTLGVAGGSFNSSVTSYKIFDANGGATTVAIGRAIDTAWKNGMDVLSNSWGGGTPSTTITDPINRASTNGRGGLGCIVLFSSGNAGRNPVEFPSYLASVVCVGSSTTHDQKKAPGTGNQFWWGGNYGEDANGDIDVVAPTVCYTTDVQGSGGYDPTDYNAVFNGTSCSCPNAAGVAALILSVNTSQSGALVKERLMRGCDKIDNTDYSTTKTYGKWNAYFGYGRVNAYNSVRMAAGVDVTPPSINHLNARSTQSTYPVSLTANILDQDGSSIPTTGNNQPKIFYRTNKNDAGWSAFDSANAISAVSNTFTFKIPGFGWETEVQYYIKAYDNTGNNTTFPLHAPNDFWLCYYKIGSLTTYTDKVPSFALPTTGTAQSTPIVVPSFDILDLTVRIYLRHTSVSDFNLGVFGPQTSSSQNRKCLFSKNGGTGDNITGASVNDTNTNFWRNGTPPYTNGNFKGDYIFRGYNGTNASGNWRINCYDDVSGNGGTADSIRLTFLRTTGTTSSCVQLNNPADSVADFGNVTFPSIDTIDFYVKNDGNANLTIASPTFTGFYAVKYSLLAGWPTTIAPNDSGLFRIRMNTAAEADVVTKRNEETITDGAAAENALLELTTNDPSKPTFKISLQSNPPLPVELASFTSITERNSVRLNWSTSYETNNSGFDIERRTIEGKEWTKAGSITGNGTTTEIKSYSFVDNNLQTGKYNYRLKQIDYNGNFEYYNLSDEVIVGIPGKFDLSQNYPNPFNPATKINYDIPVDSKVMLSIYDITGREITKLVNEIQPAGYYTVQFNGVNISSGVYFYRVISEGNGQQFVMTKRMVLVK